MIPSYENYFRSILGRGGRSNPRGLDVTEVFDAVIKFRAGEMPGRKKVNWSLGIMEGLQLIAGVFDKGAIARVAPKADLSLFTHQSAYGPRLAGQVPQVIAALREDPNTRRAVLVLPEQAEAGTAAMPCTAFIHLRVVPSAWSKSVGEVRPSLWATIGMRSSDAVYGLPYDVVQFGMLVGAVALCLDVDPGGATLNIDNGHIYDKTMGMQPDGSGGAFKIVPNYPVAPEWPELREWALGQVAAAPWPDHTPRGMVVTVPGQELL
jgi:hypothetical protein